MSATPNRFTLVTDATGKHVSTRDNQTGLEWAPAGANRHPNQQAAEKAANALELMGGGWRLPTIDELCTLIDRTKYDPAIDAEAFPFVKPSWYWSSTEAAWSSASAWFVHFYSGSVYYDHRAYYGFALAVRRAGQ